MNKLVAIFFLGAALNTVGMPAPGDLAAQFKTPPPDSQPWVFWIWLNANTTHAAITRDLEAMKAKGITGCILYSCGAGKVGPIKRKLILTGKVYHGISTDDYKDAYTTPVPTGPLAPWSPQWDDLVSYSASEANRLGLDFVLTVGLGNTSGPIPEKYSLQKLVWTETPVKGPQDYAGTLPAPPVALTKDDFPHPGPQFYHREVAVLAVPNQTDISPKAVVDLTSKMDADGHLLWHVPAGDWKIIRFLQVPTGAHNIWGYYADSLSSEALDQLWQVTMAPLLRGMKPDARRGLKGIEDDSWEAGKTKWTKLFPDEFKHRRGYDLIPWLPALAGLKIGDATNRARVLRDYALTISDLIVDNHYAHLRKLAHDHGLTCYSEACGPYFDQPDVLKTASRVDLAMAEFWMPSENRPTTMKDLLFVRNAATANHIYGKPITMCEAFTSMGPEWEETPFTMKPVADQMFCDGLNRICFHNFSQSPSLTAKPGYVYYAGTHYDPGITWWDQTSAFNTYLARCSFLLQQGKFVADAIFYRGDNVGLGEWIKTIPATLGEGYDHDNCNPEVLLTRMKVRDGRITLSDGMSYRVLILPDDQPMTLEALRKIKALIEAGATVIGPPPTGFVGMPLHAHDDEEFNALETDLWGGLDGLQLTQKKVGAGQLIWGQTAREVLRREDVPPDFQVSGVSAAGAIDWIHRQAGDVDIYYVTSKWAHPEKVSCTFRIFGKQPELWDPVTGATREAKDFQETNNTTVIALHFDSCGSVFVVFRHPILRTVAQNTVGNTPAPQVLATLSGPWSVHFDPKWGGPNTVVFNQLVDWTNRPETGIRFYSGTAVYHQTFDLATLPKSGQRILLDLGEVHEVASVQLNGSDLGILWTKPARVDITNQVKAKDNELEITVVNLWPNRLIGDESLPAKSRFTETNMHKFGVNSPLFPSGLIGPVRVLTTEP